MNDQAAAWGRAAAIYEREFVDPNLPEVDNPVRPALAALARRGATGRGAAVVADLGCGIGPLLPFLAERFQTVYAVDFAQGMLARARDKVGASKNVVFLERPLQDLAPLHGKLDVGVAVNSFVMPDVRDIDRALEETRRCLKPGGVFLGILPAMDAVHYQTMLLYDLALARGQPPDAARKHAAAVNDHGDYDFAFSQCAFDGIQQHFWHPFEIRYRFEKAGFRLTRLKKVHLAWRQFAGSRELTKHPPPWDWFFAARTRRP
jgi:SAM-dependent methyltransferase